jgi:hypothetical protein
MKTISLLTDFGLRDGYVGVMKGVIWRICPQARIADISHNISPQNVLEGAYALWRVTPYFPSGSVHVAVVDPGVGTHRRPIAARLGEHFYVAPDNGLLSAVLSQTEKDGGEIEIVCLDNPAYWLEEVSNVFHGRDIFSPVGAHLANGVPLHKLGTLIEDPQRLELPQPERSPRGVVGQIIEIDNFGNLATNVTREDLKDLGDVFVRLRGQEIHGLVNTFGERVPGDLVALFGTHNDLMVSVVNGNACQRLGAEFGDRVEVIPVSKGG